MARVLGPLALLLFHLCTSGHAVQPSARIPSPSTVHCNSAAGISGAAGGLPSTWWSNDLQDGSYIHLYSPTAKRYLDPRQRHVSATLEKPPLDSSFTAQRVPGGTLQLRTGGGEGRMMVCEGGNLVVSQSGGMGEGEENVTVQKVPESATDVHLSCFSGGVFSVLHVASVPAFEGVTLANWLITEEWQEPDLYVRVTDLLEGLKFRLLSAYSGEYIALVNKTGRLTGMSSTIPGPETVLHLSKIIQRKGHWEAQVQIRGANFDYWTLLPDGRIGGALLPDSSVDKQAFTLVKNRETRDEFMIRAGGRYLAVDGGGGLKACVAESEISTSHGSIDWNISPTVFRLEQLGGVRGEFQLHSGQISGGGGPDLPAIHRATRVTKEDFKYLAANGVNAVKIPVGYWVAMSPTPNPFPAGGAQLLDDAFQWAKEFGIRIYLSMHGARGSQNGYESSGTRDGIADWAQHAEYVADTLAAVGWLAERYSADVAFAGIGLLNEPVASRVGLEVLRDYYSRGYEAVRKHSACGFVGIQARVGEGSDVEELNAFMIEGRYTNVISEISFFEPTIEGGGGLSFAELEAMRRGEIEGVEEGSGRPVLVVSWSVAKGVKEGGGGNASSEVWANAQQRALGGARAGKFFFSHSFSRPEWEEFGFRSSVENGWL